VRALLWPRWLSASRPLLGPLLLLPCVSAYACRLLCVVLCLFIHPLLCVAVLIHIPSIICLNGCPLPPSCAVRVSSVPCSLYLL
jgi:hypothetical protein